jgi:hypothetical protein
MSTTSSVPLADFSMMRSFLSHLMAGLLAMHAVLGCCWHHGHACGRECTRTVLESADAHADHDADSCGSTDSKPCQNHGPHACQKGQCVFLRTVENGAGVSLDLNLPSLGCAASCDVSSQAPVAVRPLFAADALLPPLRLHLVHQVLLL